MKCKYCKSHCRKKGFYKKTQLYQCLNCKKYQRNNYTYNKFDEEHLKSIIAFNNEGLGIRSISRILKISPSTVQRKILHLARNISKPNFLETDQHYEIDELCTFINVNNQSCYTYITYVINRKTKQVIDFIVGNRSKENIKPLIEKLLTYNPTKIFTDRLNIYPSLIPKGIHRTYPYGTNRIERFNLTLRTHLKRLSRKTLCFSKSILMLESVLKIYLWSNTD
jgi:IS1 family transposase/transposase-like protein